MKVLLRRYWTDVLVFAVMAPIWASWIAGLFTR
jgi:hypothetical protein